MIAKYSAQIVNHGYSKNNCEFFTVKLTVVPKISVSRSTRLYTYHNATSLSKPIIQVYFKGQRNFHHVKYCYTNDLPIFIKGESIIITTPFKYVPHYKGKIMEAQTFDPNTGKYQLKPVVINCVRVFIHDNEYNHKDIIIEREINKAIKHEIQ